MIYTCSNDEEGGYKNCKHHDRLAGVYLQGVI